MYGIVRYSFAVTAAFCLLSFAGGRAIGQVLKGEAAHGSWHDDIAQVRSGVVRSAWPWPKTAHCL